MTRAWAVLLVVGCGRVGFEHASDTDAAPPRLVPAVCDVQMVGSIALTAGDAVTTVRATATPTGYAVALGTAALDIHVVRVDATLTSVDQHLPLSGGYALAGIARLADKVFILAPNGPVAYLKLLDDTFDTYVTVEDSDVLPVDPPLAPRTATTAMRARIRAGVLGLDEVDTTGTFSGLTGDYTPTAVSASIDAAPSGAMRVAYDRGDGSCETYGDLGGIAKLKTTVPACRAPRVVAFSDMAGAVAYTTPGAVGIGIVLVTGQTLGMPAIVPGASAPRLARVGDQPWVLYTGSGGVELLAYDGVDLASTLLPDVHAPYELTPTRAFWMDGTSLRAGTPCLR